MKSQKNYPVSMMKTTTLFFALDTSIFIYSYRLTDSSHSQWITSSSPRTTFPAAHISSQRYSHPVHLVRPTTRIDDRIRITFTSL